MPDPPVAQERSGWRDAGISDRHRKWGWHVPFCDIDFIEYDKKRAVALVEYKMEFAAVCTPSNANRCALVDLANRAKLPAFGVRYAKDYSWWSVVPLNSFAKKILPLPGEMMDEREYVEFLYRIRGRPVPAGVFESGAF